MALLIIKLLADDKATDLKAAIDAYAAGAGSQLLTDQRGMALDGYYDIQDGKHRTFCALAHNGDDTPASKVANQQFLFLEDDNLAALQVSLDAAMTDIIHHTRADANADANAGDITVGAAMFAAGDVGRKIIIGTSERTITAFVSSTRITYSGAAITGTGLAVSLKGAEVLQSLRVIAYREDDGDPHYVVAAAFEGQIA